MKITQMYHIKQIATAITKPRILAPTVFLAVGTGKMCYDFEKAKPEKKKRILAKDAAILLGSAAGFAAISPLTKLMCKNPFFKNNKLKNVEEVLKQALAGTINTFAGIIGAIYSNELMHKYVLNKPMFLPQKDEEQKKKEDIQNAKLPEQSDVFKSFIQVSKSPAGKTANMVFTTITDLPSMKVFSSPMIALTGFSVANTEGYHNKLKKTSYELLANTLIPTIFVSTASLFVHNKSNIKKYPVLLSSLALGSIAGTKVANKYKDQIEDTIDDINLKYVAIK